MLHRADRIAKWVNGVLMVVLGGWALVAHGQTIVAPEPPVIVLPQRRVMRAPLPDQTVRLEQVRAKVRIVDQLAVTELEVELFNPGRQRVETQVLLPVPEGSAVKELGLGPAGAEPRVQLLGRDEARKIYEDIVRKMRDPALLEFAGLNLLQTSVFPVEPGQKQWVRVGYETLLKREGERIEYVLPRSASVDYKVPWTIDVQWSGQQPLSNVYSPSHQIVAQQQRPGAWRVTLEGPAGSEPGAFRLLALAQSQQTGLSGTLVTCPDRENTGGYFLLLGGAPALPPTAQQTVKRDVILVLDRSGSMSGEKLQQVKAAAQQIVHGLEPGETFNLITYAQDLQTFAAQSVIKNDQTASEASQFIEQIVARGGTNLHDALQEALRVASPEGSLPLVLFLTDGLPTVGQTSEIAIRELASKQNPQQKRVYPFGVGTDVNTPLLEKLADDARGGATFVLPGEDVEARVGAVFAKLQGPVLTDIQVHGQRPGEDQNNLQEIMPRQMRDLFAGDQLIALGRYRGTTGTLTVSVSAKLYGDPTHLTLSTDLAQASLANAYVGRLWAQRRIAELIDAVKQLGADPRMKNKPSDPRLKELVDDIVALSQEFGILTEYTAFLAREDTDLAAAGAVRMEATRGLERQAMDKRTGLDAVAQSVNAVARKSAVAAPTVNRFYDEEMREQVIRNVQQLADGALFQRNNQWIDSRLVERKNLMQEAVPVRLASPEYFALAQRLTQQNRQALLAVDGDVFVEDAGQVFWVQTTLTVKH